MMSMYRSNYFLVGLLLILLGIQFRMIDSFVLNPPATKVLAKISQKTRIASISDQSFFGGIYPNPTHRVTPPRWLGLAMIAVGTVIGFHAMAIPRHRE